MPAETKRLHKRIGLRDRWFLALVTGVVLVCAPTAIVVSAHSSPQLEPGCVTTIRAHFMGGATVKYCGSRAVTFCREQAAEGKHVPSQCEKLVATRATQ